MQHADCARPIARNLGEHSENAKAFSPAKTLTSLLFGLGASFEHIRVRENDRSNLPLMMAKGKRSKQSNSATSAEGSQWVMAHTDEGDTYWYNAVTLESTWNDPNVPAKSSVAPNVASTRSDSSIVSSRTKERRARRAQRKGLDVGERIATDIFSNPQEEAPVPSPSVPEGGFKQEMSYEDQLQGSYMEPVEKPDFYEGMTEEQKGIWKGLVYDFDMDKPETEIRQKRTTGPIEPYTWVDRIFGRGLPDKTGNYWLPYGYLSFDFALVSAAFIAFVYNPENVLTDAPDEIRNPIKTVLAVWFSISFFLATFARSIAESKREPVNFWAAKVFLYGPLGLRELIKAVPKRSK